MRILTFTSAFFLVCMLSMSGCQNAAFDWSHLYQSDGEEADAVCEDEDNIEKGAVEAAVDESIQIHDTIQVHVCGAVVSPGVYELPKGARVNQAIEAAGGLTEDADSLLVNQARVAEDGEQIRIYTKEEAATVSSQMMTSGKMEGKININTADAQQLMTLPGIGEAKASDIITYRKSSGAFEKIEDIMNIPGIKEAVFTKIRDKITV